MSSRISRAQRARTRSARFETLEDRRLLSAAPPFTLAEYMAQINGTAEVATLVKDDFAGTAGQVSTNSPLEVCPGDSQWRGVWADVAMLDGSGNLTGVDNDTRYTWTDLGPVPANSLLAVNTTVSFPGGNNAKLAFGFGQGASMLDDAANNSGPWVLMNRNNTITLYTGSNSVIATGTFQAGFHNNEDRAVEFLYDVSTQSVRLTIGGETMFGGWVNTNLGAGSDAVDLRNHFTMQVVDTADETPDLIGKFRDIDVSMITRPAMTYLQDDFAGTGAVTGSVKEVDLQHTAWSGDATLSGGSLVGVDSASANRRASIDLAPLGPDSVVCATSSFTFTKSNYQKVSYGFSSDANAFGANSGAWVQINRSGTLTLYRGSTSVATASYTFANDTPYSMLLLYDVGSQQIAMQINGTTVAFTGAVNGWRDTGIGTGVNGETLRDRLTLQIDDTSADGGVAKINEVKLQVLTRRPPKNDFSGAATANFSVQASAVANTEALWALVNTTYGGDNVIVKFAAGDYHFAASALSGRSDAEQVLTFTNLANVKFEGGPGVNIWIDDPTRGFIQFGSCTNVAVTDMNIDYTTIPWGQGTITGIHDDGVTGHRDSIDVQFDVGALAGGGTLIGPLTGAAAGAEAIWGYVIQKDANGNEIPGRMRENTGQYAAYDDGITLVSGTTYNILLSGNTSETSTAEDEREQLQVGDSFVLHYRYNGSGLLSANNCANVTFSNLAVYAAPQVVFTGETTTEMNVLNCWTEVKDGRWKTTDGDTVHLRSPRIGPWVEGCTFTGIGDDVANLYTIPFSVESQSTVSGKTVLTVIKLVDYQETSPYDLYGINDFKVGDHLTFYNPNTGALMFTATVSAFNRNLRQVTLDRTLTAGELSQLATGNSYQATTIFNDSLATSYMILDNDWSNSYRTFNAKAHNGQIVGNYFEGLGGPAIMIRNEPDWPEGLVPSNVIIAGNEFVNNALQYAYLNSDYLCGSIDVHLARQTRSSGFANLPIVTSDLYGPSDIKILDNVFTDWRRRAITAFNVNRLDIIGNTFNDPKDDVAVGVPIGALDRIVDIYRCANVTIDDSSYGDTPNDLVQRGTQTIANYGTITYYGFPAGSYLMAGGGESEAMLSNETLNALFDLMLSPFAKKDRVSAVDAALADLN